MMILAEIRGVPCLVQVTHYEPGEPPHMSGHPDSWDPGYPPEVEFRVLDLQQQPAPALEASMNDADTRAIEQEIVAAKDAEAQQRQADLAEAHYYAEHA